jgi:hypothetical protein
MGASEHDHAGALGAGALVFVLGVQARHVVPIAVVRPVVLGVIR